MSVPAPQDLARARGTAGPSPQHVPPAVIAAAQAAFSSRDPLSRTLGLLTDFRDLDEDAAALDDARELVFCDVDMRVTVTAKASDPSDASDACVIAVTTTRQVTSVAVEVWGGDQFGASPAGPGEWTLPGLPSGILRVVLHDDRGTAQTSWVRL